MTSEIVTIPLPAGEREREAALRARFLQFWSTARGEPRAIFDSFISSTPIADGVSFERVVNANANGWWAYPPEARQHGVILHVHGGGYVQGSANAFRGFASQLASRALCPVFVVDYPLASPAAPLLESCSRRG
jgi:acetyl esterase/lipase